MPYNHKLNGKIERSGHNGEVSSFYSAEYRVDEIHFANKEKCVDVLLKIH